MPLVLGVDCSTQATKVEVRDADSGELVASGSAAHPATTPPRSEQDPEAWWAALLDAVGRARPGGRGGDIAAVAVAAQQHGMVALDGGHRVVRPAKLWNDTESAADAAWLVERGGGPDAWARACGSVPTAAFTVTKLSWLHRRGPEAFAATAHVLLPHDWLTLRLSGRTVTDRGDASGTGYWSPSSGGWRTDLLDLVDPDRPWEQMLPDVLGPAEPAGRLTGEAAASTGLAPGALVAAGTGDNMAAALAVGLGPGSVVFSIGTSGTVYTVSERPTADPTGAVAGFADATGRFLPLVCTLNATKVTDAFARLLGVDHGRLSELALSAPSGSGGVVLVPYLDGERTPDRPGATGALAGLRSDVSPAQVARAAFEGVVCGLLDGFDALASSGVPRATRALLVGGGARSPAYRRILADLSRMVVEVPAAIEQVATGACVQAAAVLSGRSPADVAGDWRAGPAETVEPDASVDAGAVRAAYAAASGAQSR